MGVGDSEYRVVDIWVGSGVGSDDGIKFGIDDGSEYIYSYGFFDVSNDYKHVGSLIDE